MRLRKSNCHLVAELHEYLKNFYIEHYSYQIKKYIKENADKYSISEKEFTDYVGGEDAIEYDLKLNKALDIVKEA